MSSNNSDSDEIDTSWTKNYERLVKIQQNYLRENMTNIDIHFLYINPNQYIDKIISKSWELSVCDGYSRLEKSVILQIVQNNRILHGIKYRLLDTLLFNIDLEPENIQSFSKIDLESSKIDLGSGSGLAIDSQFCKPISGLDNDIIIPPSIFIFHDLNAIYMIFQEVVVPTTLPKPILKILVDGEQFVKTAHKITKRVILNLGKARKKTMKLVG